MSGNLCRFDALAITEAEIDSLGPAQVRGQASDEKVVFRAHSALDAARTRRGIFTNMQALLLGTFHKRVTDNHEQRSLARQLADTFGQRDDFAQDALRIRRR